MLIDSFPFFNELDLLELRLNELYQVVDKFIIVEANKTQSLLDKPFFFEENKERYKKFIDKIIYIKLTECPDNSANLWTMENFQRNSIILGLSKLELCSNDRIMISDLDEIPKAEAVKYAMQSNLMDLPIFTFDIDFFVYFMNLKAKNKIWPGTTMFKPELLQNYSIQSIKDGKNNYIKLPNAGWHFSWLGGYKKIREKALSCIEPYDKSAIPDEQTFKEYFDNYILNPQKRFIHIENLSLQGIELEIVYNYNYPQYLINNMNKYEQYFYRSN